MEKKKREKLGESVEMLGWIMGSNKADEHV